MFEAEVTVTVMAVPVAGAPAGYSCLEEVCLADNPVRKISTVASTSDAETLLIDIVEAFDCVLCEIHHIFVVYCTVSAV